MFAKWKSSHGLQANPKLLFGIAQISLIAFSILHFFAVPHTDFLQGVLLGISITGNLATLIRARKDQE